MQNETKLEILLLAKAYCKEKIIQRIEKAVHSETAAIYKPLCTTYKEIRARNAIMLKEAFYRR